MGPYIFIAAFFSLTIFSAIGQDCNKELANNFLNSLFQNGSYISYDSTKFKDYHKELQIINTPTIQSLLPDYCFFYTTFTSEYYEYLNVETILAFPQSLNKKVFLLHSPVFTNHSQEFIQLFYGLKAKDSAQSVALSKEIVTIFSDVTYLGHINRLNNLKDKNTISFELWHGDLSWRIFDFYFDNANILRDVKLKGGVKREKMSEDYKRE